MLPLTNEVNKKEVKRYIICANEMQGVTQNITEESAVQPKKLKPHEPSDQKNVVVG